MGEGQKAKGEKTQLSPFVLCLSSLLIFTGY